MFSGIFGKCGIAKENPAGTFVAPTKIRRFIPPFDFQLDKTPLISQAVSGVADLNQKWAQGPAMLKSGKMKYEVEPEGGIEEDLMALFGTDTITEVATFTVSLGVNDKIDFTEDADSLVTATLTPGTYAMGASSAAAGSLCALVKAAMEAVNGASTYTVTYSYTTKKVTITKSTGVFVINWLSGPNTLIAADALLGFNTVNTASAIAATSTATTSQFVMSHAFTRLQSATLPSYSWWQQNGVDYPEFAGCYLNKLDLDIKNGEFVVADSDWIGFKYEANGTTQAGTPSALAPYKFDQAVVTLGGAPNTDMAEMKISLSNNVAVEHVVGNTIYGTKASSHGIAAQVSGTIIFEDVTEMTKFRNGTSSSLTVVLTSSEAIVTGKYYSLTLTIPLMYYRSAALPIQKGALKVAFTADAILDPVTGKTISVTAVNTIGAAL
jgi:hypothetical protein